MGPVVTYAYK